MEAYLPYLISVIGGAVIPAILARFGIKVPVITPTVPTPAPVSPWPAPAPTPSPAPVVPVAAPHQALTGCLEWAARARAKLLPVTEADQQAIGSLCPLLNDLAKPAEPAKPVG